MSKTIAAVCALLLWAIMLHAQPKELSVAQQNEDFSVFRTGLAEGHAGLYYYIDKKIFEQKCDNIAQSFSEHETAENFYLKLRFLVACLHHGHTRISLPTQSWVNYKMGVLDSNRLYLPFELLISNEQLLIKADCSREQLFPRYSVIEHINDTPVKALLHKMLPYMPADGVNQSFKYYSLYNYFHFHLLLNLFYPDKQGISIKIKNSRTDFYVQLLQPRTIDSIYMARNGVSISNYDKQLAYQSNLGHKTAYLKIGSFYKGLIENFGQHYDTFLDSAFLSMQSEGTQTLILDLRNNEGGGDGYENTLLSYLIDSNKSGKAVIQVPGRQFSSRKYAVNLTDDISAFIDNPAEFLRDDSSLHLKEKYVAMMTEGKSAPVENRFRGNIIVLIKGGSFSASNAVIGQLYQYRRHTERRIQFVGEENGGDIYTNAGCAGQGYTIKLPVSQIQLDMPFLCFGEFRPDYPKKRLPDIAVYDTPENLLQGKDKVLDFAIKYAAGWK